MNFIRFFGRWRVAAWLALLCVAAGDLPAQEAWEAGAARVNITPGEFMWMAGYGGRSHPADQKYSELWAKALVLEDPRGERGILVTMDLVGMDRTLAASICEAIGEQAGCRRSQIALCFTHTHSGPVVGRNLEPLHYRQLDDEQRRLVDQYASELQRRIVACVGEALRDLEPCSLAWGSGTAGFAVNRRANPERDVPRLIAEGKLLGPVDHDVPVLAVRELPTGELKAVVFGYACHATVLDGYGWCGDYPGFAQESLETSHAGCTAMFWAGCGADQNPLPRRSLELAGQYGRQLASAVDHVLAGSMTAISGPLVTAYREVALPLDRLPTVDELRRDSQSDNRHVRARAEMLLERIDAGEPLPPTYPYPVGVWELGEQVQFVFLGGEVVVDYAVRLKSELRGPRTWVAGYSNDVMAYIPSLRVLREGGYEGIGAMVYYGLPTGWAPQVEQAIVDTVHAMTDRGSESK
ncbi:MAG: hypothetical protein FJ276_01760 [Planctomycetes bacterium]|nr:hypothetical protein [Planctomycetota bacterium]